jgi:SulP family sulfate permease
MTLLDLQTRRELFAALPMLGLTVASNPAVGFIAGVIVAGVLESERLCV